MAWKTLDLTGTKNGSNTSFTVPFGYRAGTLKIVHNMVSVYMISTGSPAATQALVIGTAVTMGTAPASTDTLWARGFEV